MRIYNAWKEGDLYLDMSSKDYKMYTREELVNMIAKKWNVTVEEIEEKITEYSSENVYFFEHGYVRYAVWSGIEFDDDFFDEGMQGSETNFYTSESGDEIAILCRFGYSG